MNQAEILYIEDNEDYIEFVKRAIRKINAELHFGVATDGKNALAIFEEEERKKRLPRLILLDINLPDYNGLDLLKKLRGNKATRYIPIVMLSSSENQSDMKKAFDNGANAYLIKPIGIAPLTDVLNSVCNFWLNHNQIVEHIAA
ncbi:MAG: response regulator [Chitinophagaceae bacterium]|nr:MAG: response regulator [Chitinophagaceae bacterium]